MYYIWIHCLCVANERYKLPLLISFTAPQAKLPRKKNCGTQRDPVRLVFVQDLSECTPRHLPLSLTSYINIRARHSFGCHVCILSPGWQAACAARIRISHSIRYNNMCVSHCFWMLSCVCLPLSIYQALFLIRSLCLPPLCSQLISDRQIFTISRPRTIHLVTCFGHACTTYIYRRMNMEFIAVWVWNICLSYIKMNACLVRLCIVRLLSI